VHDLIVDAGVPYLVMELVGGDDLQTQLAHGPLDIPATVEIALQICAALEAAHRAGIVHRDIKPDNVLLAPNGVVKVCDFGIAGGRAAAPRGPEAVVGTSDYMAPEQAAGGPVDARTDLYALGCVIYAMLTGRPPFAAGDARYVVWQQIHQTPRPVASRRPDVPDELDALVGQLLAKAPADRPATARDVADRLAGLVGQTAVPVGRHTVAAAGATAAVQARASVVTPTQTMPELPIAEPTGNRRSFRLGPAGIAAVAVGAAAITALIVALVLAAGGPQPESAAPNGTTPTITADVSATGPTATESQAPGARVDDVRAAIQAQALAGQLDDQKANDLIRRLDEIQRRLSSGDADKATEKIAEFRKKIDEIHREGKITDAGRDALNQALASWPTA
jgi:hypothetical protein